jgi:hypothetical protein
LLAAPDMHTYIDLYFTPESLSPPEIRERVRATTGLSFIRGSHDLKFDWTTEEEFRAALLKIHEALKGTGVFYRVETVPDETGFVEPVPWPALPRTHRLRY